MRALLLITIGFGVLQASRAQTVVALVPGAGRVWDVEISGVPGARLARAQIIAAAISEQPALPRFLLQAQAGADLRLEAATSRPARLSMVGGVTIGFCPTAAAFALSRVKSHSAQANIATIGASAAGIACALWGAVHTQVQKDTPNPEADVARLLPDTPFLLDSGSWSGLLVAATPGGKPLTLRLP